MRRFAILFIVVLVASTFASAAPAFARPASVKDLESQIAEAHAQIARWDRGLARWQVRLARASGLVQRLTWFADRSLTDPHSREMQRRGLRRERLLDDVLARAHARFGRVLRDPENVAALQQVEAWSSRLSDLEAALERALSSGGTDFSFAPGQPVTYESWARGFLDRLGAPACEENLAIVVTWETSESTLAAFNPLATTRDMPGAVSMNSHGVKDYLSLRQGLDAARDTLLLGAESYDYGSIVARLRGCAPAAATAEAINASAWCRECTEGRYVTGLLPLVRASYAEHASRLISTSPA